jgi:hypothetical protein
MNETRFHKRIALLQYCVTAETYKKSLLFRHVIVYINTRRLVQYKMCATISPPLVFLHKITAHIRTMRDGTTKTWHVRLIIIIIIIIIIITPYCYYHHFYLIVSL